MRRSTSTTTGNSTKNSKKNSRNRPRRSEWTGKPQAIKIIIDLIIFVNLRFKLLFQLLISICINQYLCCVLLCVGRVRPGCIDCEALSGAFWRHWIGLIVRRVCSTLTAATRTAAMDQTTLLSYGAVIVIYARGRKKTSKHNVKIKQSAMVSLYLLFFCYPPSALAHCCSFFRYIISTLFLSPPCGGSCCVLFALRSIRTFENHNELKNYKRNL